MLFCHGEEPECPETLLPPSISTFAQGGNHSFSLQTNACTCEKQRAGLQECVMSLLELPCSTHPPAYECCSHFTMPEKDYGANVMKRDQGWP